MALVRGVEPDMYMSQATLKGKTFYFYNRITVLIHSGCMTKGMWWSESNMKELTWLLFWILSVSLVIVAAVMNTANLLSYSGCCSEYCQSLSPVTVAAVTNTANLLSYSGCCSEYCQSPQLQWLLFWILSVSSVTVAALMNTVSLPNYSGCCSEYCQSP